MQNQEICSLLEVWLFCMRRERRKRERQAGMHAGHRLTDWPTEREEEWDVALKVHHIFPHRMEALCLRAWYWSTFLFKGKCGIQHSRFAWYWYIYILLPNSIRCKNVKYSVTLEGWILAKVMTTRQRKGEGSWRHVLYSHPQNLYWFYCVTEWSLFVE